MLSPATKRKRILILGAAGRDFHDFNVVFRDDPACEVVAFTAAQIPGIAGRRYPPRLSGPLYPDGIPIFAESELEELLARHRIDEVVFAYSDVSHEAVMHLAVRAVASGADFRLLGAAATMLPAAKPVLSICAVRTGAGKSPIARHVAERLRDAGLRIAVVRHPMPYGDLERMAVQRFASAADLVGCTIEEREEYEPHLALGHVVFAGVDYGCVLREAEAGADAILWDGGNNDLPFFVPDLEIVVADPHRAGHERRFFPGEVNLLRADVVVISKCDTADPRQIEAVRESVNAANPRAQIIDGGMPVSLDRPEIIRGARVLVVEDGPTLTHGGMAYGAGTLAARAAGAAALVDPRPFATGTVREVFATYPHIGPLLPATGYGEAQIRDLAETIRRTPCDAVVIATPIDLARLVAIEQPTCRARYEYADRGAPTLDDVLAPFIRGAQAKATVSR